MLDQGTLDQYRQRFQQESAPQSTQQTPQSSGGGLGGFLKSIVSPFINTGADVSNFIGNREVDIAHSLGLAKNVQKKTNKEQFGNIPVVGGLVQNNTPKQFLGNAAQVGASVVLPEAKAGLAAKALQGAKLGATAGAGHALANNENIVKGTLEGAATGGVANGFLGKLLKTGSPTTTNATDEAVMAAKQAAGVRQPISSGGAQIRKYGTDLLANKLNVGTKDAERLNGPDTVATLQKNYGLTPHQAATLHPVITGSEGASTDAMNAALENVGKVKFSDFAETMKKGLEDPEFISANNLSNSQVKNLRATIDKYHTSLNSEEPSALTKGATDLTTSGTNARNAMDLAKQLEKSGYTNSAATSESKNAVGDMQLKMADFIKSRIYNSKGGEQALAEAKNQTGALLDSVAGKSGNAKLHQVADDFRNVKTWQDFRNVSAPFVNAKQLVDKSNINDFANKGSNGYKGIGGTLLSAASKVASPIGGKILSNIGNKIDNISPEATDTVAKQPGILSRLTSGKKGQAIAQASIVGTQGILPQDTQPKTQEGALSSGELSGLESSIGTPSQENNATQEGTVGFDKNTLLAMVAADPKNADTYISLYKIAGSDLPNSQNAAAQKSAQTAENSQAALDEIVSSFNAAGGGKGIVGGSLENLGSKVGLNSNVATYNDTATALAAQIYKALGNTGTISDQDQKLITRLIPKTTDTSQTASAKINQLQDLLQRAQNIAGQGTQ